MLSEVPPARITDDCLDKIMRRIDNKAQTPQPCSGHAVLPDGLNVPLPIHALLERNCAGKVRCWSHIAKGVDKIDIHICASEPRRRKLRLMRLAPLQTTPLHTHAGREITLVLDGGFTDQRGHYTKGDIVLVQDPRLAHSPRADETGCLMLTLTEGPLRFAHPIEQILNLFRRI